MKTANLVRDWTAAIGWRLPLRETLGGRRPVALIYHGVPRAAPAPQVDARTFEEHVAFLAKNFAPIGARDVAGRRPPRAKIQVLLTFDDGFRNNAEVVAPILRRYNVPAIFFVCTRHAAPGKYLWFSYLKMLEKSFRGNGFTYDGEFLDMAPGARRTTMANLERRLLALAPHPARMYEVIEEQLPRLEDFADEAELHDVCAGMSVEQMGELAADPLFTVGVHTADHPMLTKCDANEIAHQIGSNKRWIEAATGRGCDSIAYPNGDYDREVLGRCRALGFKQGYAVKRRINFDRQLEIPRVGIYARPTDELGFKVRWGGLIGL